MANAWSTASLAPWPPPGITPLTLSTTSGLSPGRRPESRCRGSPQCGFGEGSADRRSVPAAFARGAGRIVPARGPRLLAFDRGCARRGYRLSDQVIPLFAEFKHSSLPHAQRCCDGARDAGGYDRECRRSPGGRGQGSMPWYSSTSRAYCWCPSCNRRMTDAANNQHSERSAAHRGIHDL